MTRKNTSTVEALYSASVLDVSLRTLIAMFIRWSTLSGLCLLSFWLAVWLIKSDMPRSLDGKYSRLLDACNGFWVGAILIASLFLTRRSRESASSIIPDAEGRLYYRSDAISVFLCWAISCYCLAVGMLSGFMASLDDSLLLLIIFLWGKTSLSFGMPQVIAALVARLEKGDSKIARFFSGR